MRRIAEVSWVVMLVLLVSVTTGCLGGRSSGGAQQAETPGLLTAPPLVGPAVSPVETPVAQPELALLSMTAPETVAVGAVFPVTLELIGVTTGVRDVWVEVPVPILYLQVLDEDAAPGVQVLPGDLPPGAQVVRNEVGADGVVVYQVSGLGASAGLSRLLFTMRLQATAPGVVDLAVRHLALTAEDGTPLVVQTQTLLLEILPAGATAEPILTVVPPPVTAVPVTPTVGALQGLYVRVEPGQNLFRLAQTYGSTVEQLAAANGITDVHRLPAGMVLRIPVQPPTGLGQAAYRVAAGDTLYSIGRRFGLTVETLAGFNQLAAPYAIRAGQWLILRP